MDRKNIRLLFDTLVGLKDKFQSSISELRVNFSLVILQATDVIIQGSIPNPDLVSLDVQVQEFGQSLFPVATELADVRNAALNIILYLKILRHEVCNKDVILKIDNLIKHLNSLLLLYEKFSDLVLTATGIVIKINKDITCQCISTLNQDAASLAQTLERGQSLLPEADNLFLSYRDQMISLLLQLTDVIGCCKPVYHL